MTFNFWWLNTLSYDFWIVIFINSISYDHLSWHWLGTGTGVFHIESRAYNSVRVHFPILSSIFFITTSSSSFISQHTYHGQCPVLIISCLHIKEGQGSALMHLTLNIIQFKKQSLETIEVSCVRHMEILYDFTRARQQKSSKERWEYTGPMRRHDF